MRLCRMTVVTRDAVALGPCWARRTSKRWSSAARSAVSGLIPRGSSNMPAVSRNGRWDPLLPNIESSARSPIWCYSIASKLFPLAISSKEVLLTPNN